MNSNGRQVDRGTVGGRPLRRGLLVGSWHCALQHVPLWVGREASVAKPLSRPSKRAGCGHVRRATFHALQCTLIVGAVPAFNVI